MAKQKPQPTGHERARYGAAAVAGDLGQLPNPFPRIMGPNALKYLTEYLESGLTANFMDRFEHAFAQKLGVKHVIATPGCTPALHMLAVAWGFGPGDEVIVSPISDYGTVAGLIHENLIPVFADVDPGTVNFSAATIEPLITARTRAILCVHKTGIVCDMDPIVELARRHGLKVYEDACQAVMGRYRGRLVGTLADAAAFSFDPEKTLGSDTGGCLVTDDDELAEQARFVCHSRGGVAVPHFGRQHIVPGHAIRMPNGCAAITLAQLEIIDENVAQRDRMIRLLSAQVDDIPGVQALPIPEYMDVYSAWMFGMTIDLEQFTCSAEEFGSQLAAAGIPGASTAEYYLLPAALPFLEQHARAGKYPYSQPPASREYHYADACPQARALLKRSIRWCTFCEKYTEAHTELAARLIRQVAKRNRR